jgi:hypothetical protein
VDPAEETDRNGGKMKFGIADIALVVIAIVLVIAAISDSVTL